MSWCQTTSTPRRRVKRRSAPGNRFAPAARSFPFHPRSRKPNSAREHHTRYTVSHCRPPGVGSQGWFWPISPGVAAALSYDHNGRKFGIAWITSMLSARRTATPRSLCYSSNDARRQERAARCNWTQWSNLRNEPKFRFRTGNAEAQKGTKGSGNRIMAITFVPN